MSRLSIKQMSSLLSSAALLCLLAVVTTSNAQPNDEKTTSVALFENSAIMTSGSSAGKNVAPSEIIQKNNLIKRKDSVEGSGSQLVLSSAPSSAVNWIDPLDTAAGEKKYIVVKKKPKMKKIKMEVYKPKYKYKKIKMKVPVKKMKKKKVKGYLKKKHHH